MIFFISWYISGLIITLVFLKIDTGKLRIKDILFSLFFALTGLIGLLALVDLLIKDERFLKDKKEYFKNKILNFLNKKIL